MAEESLHDIIQGSKTTKSHKAGIVFLVVVFVLILLGGAYYLINTLANQPGSGSISSTSPETVSSGSATPAPSPSASSAISTSDQDDTTTLKKELDSTTLNDISPTEDSSLTNDITKLK